jgi:hypothetical protein
VKSLPGAKEIILAKLTKHVQGVFPSAEVRVKPMQANVVNSDCTKIEKEKLNRLIEVMFEEADMWLVSEH